jgi:hypothetical protein
MNFDIYTLAAALRQRYIVYSWKSVSGLAGLGGKKMKKAVTLLLMGICIASGMAYAKPAWAVVQPTITVTKPDGTAPWTAGTTKTIKWTYTGTPGASVQADLYDATGAAFQTTIVASAPIGTAGSGFYAWAIPSTQAGGQYTVKVTSKANASVSGKSAVFTVLAPPTNFAATTGDGQVSVSWSPYPGATSYNIYYGTSSGVTKATGTKVANAAAGQVISGLTNCKMYFFMVTAVSGTKESAASIRVPAVPAASGTFCQADLTGSWDGINFSTGNKAGWKRWSVTISGAGNITFTSYQDSAGGTPPAGLTLGMDSDGILSGNWNPTFSGSMSSGKVLIVGTQTFGGGKSFEYTVMRKRIAGVTYSNSDVANLRFSFHSLLAGDSNVWQYGEGSTNGSGQITLVSNNDPSGPVTLPPPNYEILLINRNGIVTGAINKTLHGMMTSDKKIIFGIQTISLTHVKYEFFVSLASGQTFTQPDLAGSYDFHVLVNGVLPGWILGTFDVDANGTQTYASYRNSLGNTTLPASDVLSVDPSGTITSSTEASFNGQMSFYKDLFVRTKNQKINGVKNYSIGISIK